MKTVDIHRVPRFKVGDIIIHKTMSLSRSIYQIKKINIKQYELQCVQSEVTNIDKIVDGDIYLVDKLYKLNLTAILKNL